MQEEQEGSNPSTPWWRGFYKQFAPSCQYDDWHPEVMKNLDPKAWVDCFVEAGFDCIHPDSKPHSGNAYYRTDLDHIHNGLHGRDFLGELIELCHQKGIKVVTNQSIFFDNYLFKEHPDWRIRDADGRDSKAMNIAGYRLGIVCMNSPYREIARKQLETYLKKYPVDGVFFDEIFIFIPVCYCNYCRERYRIDCGATLPTTDELSSTAYKRYVNWRDNCLEEFLEGLVQTVHSARPGIPLTFNSPRIGTRPYSQLGLLKYADFASGDPVPWENSIALAGSSISYWSNATPKQPANLHIGRFQRKDTQNGMMPLENLVASFALCMAYGCSFQAARETQPDGSLYTSIFKLYRKAFDTIQLMKPYWGGEKVRCAAVYYSWDTKRNLLEFHTDTPDKGHTREAIYRLAEDYYSGIKTAFKVFQDEHIPGDVISKLNLEYLDQYKLLCLPDGQSLSLEEVNHIREYVYRGGNLLATRFTSLYDEDENECGNFALADVFGVDYLGKTDGKETFVEPAAELRQKAAIPNDFEVMVDQQALVKARPGTKVWAQIGLPYTNRSNDANQWVNIWTSPLGLHSGYPAVVFNQYGAGSCCYLSWQFAKVHQAKDVHTPPSLEILGKLFLAIARMLLANLPMEIDAPPWVVTTVFRKDKEKQVVVHCVNCQVELPIQPVRNIGITIRLLPEEDVAAVHNAQGHSLEFDVVNGEVHIRLKELASYELAVLQLS